MARALLCVWALAASAYAAEFYVAPDGRDSNPGTLARPFATIVRARDEVRKLVAAGLRESATVSLRGGTYALSETVVFGLEDSGTPEHPIAYAAYRDEEPVVTSAVKIAGWKKLSQPPAALPAAARGKVWVADVPPELPRFYSLYDRQGHLPRARSEGFVPLRPAGEPPPDFKARNRDALETLYYPAGVIRNWTNLDDVEVIVRPAWWTMNILALQSVDEKAGVARTRLPGTYALRPLEPVWYFPVHPKATAWVENVLEALDEPGEWVLDTHARKLYLWPRTPAPDSIVAPRLRELIRVEGRIDVPGPVDVPAHDLVFRGITFEHADRDLWTADDNGMQHDWEMEDKPDALVRMRGAERCTVEYCRFRDSGGNAIRLDYYAQGNRLAGNEIRNLGQGGIVLFGYGPGTKDVNRRNEILNNDIHHCGILYWHSHGIILWQSGGNRVANNYIHDMPRKAVCISGARFPYFAGPGRREREVARTFRWFEIGDPPKTWDEATKYLHTRDNIVENNEIARVLLKLSDGAAMNISGAGPGNVFRHNYLHDIFGEESPTAVLRNDDWQTGSVWEDNVIVRSNALFAENKGNNDIVNNVVIDMDSRRFPGAYFQALAPLPWDGARFERNIFYDSKRATEFFSYLPRGKLGPEVFAHVEFGHNLYYDARPDKSSLPQFLREMRARGIGLTDTYADPLFVDAGRGDYRLRPDSPALKLGIKSIDLGGVGLTADFPKRLLQ
jgi:hypothetical protein